MDTAMCYRDREAFRTGRYFQIQDVIVIQKKLSQK